MKRAIELVRNHPVWSKWGTGLAPIGQAKMGNSSWDNMLIMKINFKNISQILKTDSSIRKGFANEQKKKHDKASEFQKMMAHEMIGDMDYHQYIDEVFHSVMHPNCKRYILTKSAWDVIDRIQIDKFDMNMLGDKVPKDETLEFMIDPQTCLPSLLF